MIVATADELSQVKAGRADPRAGPLNGPNEDQALRTLQVAIQDMLAAVRRAPLLADAAAVGDAVGGGDANAAAAAAASSEQVQKQLGDLRLQQPEEQQQQGATAEQQPQANENGFDADWRLSRHFCCVYLRGQRAILERSLAECELLLGQLDPQDA